MAHNTSEEIVAHTLLSLAGSTQPSLDATSWSAGGSSDVASSPSPAGSKVGLPGSLHAKTLVEKIGLVSSRIDAERAQLQQRTAEVHHKLVEATCELTAADGRGVIVEEGETIVDAAADGTAALVADVASKQRTTLHSPASAKVSSTLVLRINYSVCSGDCIIGVFPIVVLPYD